MLPSEIVLRKTNALKQEFASVFPGKTIRFRVIVHRGRVDIQIQPQKLPVDIMEKAHYIGKKYSEVYEEYI